MSFGIEISIPIPALILILYDSPPKSLMLSAKGANKRPAPRSAVIWGPIEPEISTANATSLKEPSTNTATVPSTAPITPPEAFPRAPQTSSPSGSIKLTGLFKTINRSRPSGQEQPSRFISASYTSLSHFVKEPFFTYFLTQRIHKVLQFSLFTILQDPLIIKDFS